jgi:hypothetical protein
VRPVHPATLRFALALALTAVAGPVLAQGGPPLITDDPDTPGPHHWEINLSFFREQAPHEHLCETPRLDLNYGEGRRFQLRLETPHLLEREDGGGRRSGLGDTTAGVKWRFLGEEGQRLAWAVYA